MDFFNLQTRLAYQFTVGNGLLLTPTLDLNATHLSLDAVTETDGGAAGLATSGEKDLIFSVSPSLEIAQEFALSLAVNLRAFADLGVTIFANDGHSQTASFLAAPVGTDPFEVSTNLDRAIGDVAIGATLSS